MDLLEMLLDSWERQCKIVSNVAALVDESNRKVKPSEDGMPLDHQLAHMHLVRHYWLKNFDPKRGKALESAFIDGWKTPIDDLDKIKSLLAQSGKAVRESVEESVKNGAHPSGGYENPILFLEHMVWHDGWHVGLIFLGLRLNGQEPSEEWDEPNVWGLWRTE